MFTGQIKKIRKAIDKFHDDIKHDVNRQLHELEG